MKSMVLRPRGYSLLSTTLLTTTKAVSITISKFCSTRTILALLLSSTSTSRIRESMLWLVINVSRVSLKIPAHGDFERETDEHRCQIQAICEQISRHYRRTPGRLHLQQRHLRLEPNCHSSRCGTSHGRLGYSRHWQGVRYLAFCDWMVAGRSEKYNGG